MTEFAGQFNYLDFLLLAILAASVVASIIRGFTREIAGLVALILGVLLGMWFHGAVATYVLEYVAAPQIASLVGFSVIFLAVVIAGGLIGVVISKALQVSGLSLFDRLAGAAFGLVKGALFGAVIVFALLAFSPSGPPKAVSSSKVAPYVLWSADVLAALAPQDIKAAALANIDSIRDVWGQRSPDLPGIPAEPASPPQKPGKKPSASR